MADRGVPSRFSASVSHEAVLASVMVNQEMSAPSPLGTSDVR